MQTAAGPYTIFARNRSAMVLVTQKEGGDIAAFETVYERCLQAARALEIQRINEEIRQRAWAVLEALSEE